MQVTATTSVRYPVASETSLARVELVNVYVGYMLSQTCLVDSNYYQWLLVSRVGLLVVLAVLVATFATTKVRNKLDAVADTKVSHKHVSAALFVSFVVYGPV